MENELVKKHCEQANKVGLVVALFVFVGFSSYWLSDLDAVLLNKETGQLVSWADMPIFLKFVAITLPACYAAIFATGAWLVAFTMALIYKEIREPSIKMSLKDFMEASKSKRERDKFKNT